jgi:hypothetical protein
MASAASQEIAWADMGHSSTAPTAPRGPVAISGSEFLTSHTRTRHSGEKASLPVMLPVSAWRAQTTWWRLIIVILRNTRILPGTGGDC